MHTVEKIWTFKIGARETDMSTGYLKQQIQSWIHVGSVHFIKSCNVIRMDICVNVCKNLCLIAWNLDEQTNTYNSKRIML